jgi:hypothetical protein
MDDPKPGDAKAQSSLLLVVGCWGLPSRRKHHRRGDDYGPGNTRTGWRGCIPGAMPDRNIVTRCSETIS